MNLHLTYTKNKEINGYVNIDVLDEASKSNLENISTASCSSVVFSECLQLLDYEKSIEILDKGISKLRKGGQINMSIVDIGSFAVDLINSQLTDENASKFLYYTNSCIGLDVLKQKFKDKSIVIDSLEKRDYFLIITGKRK